MILIPIHIIRRCSPWGHFLGQNLVKQNAMLICYGTYDTMVIQKCAFLAGEDERLIFHFYKSGIQYIPKQLFQWL
jgi:hypothetical protein